MCSDALERVEIQQAFIDDGADIYHCVLFDQADRAKLEQALNGIGLSWSLRVPEGL